MKGFNSIPESAFLYISSEDLQKEIAKLELELKIKKKNLEIIESIIFNLNNEESKEYFKSILDK